MILVTGGTRSGKSTLAEHLAAGFGGRVLYVATAEPGDDEMRLRIERHQADRPPDWGTLNAPRDAIGLLREEEGRWDTILFDCLTLYTTNLLLENEAESPDPEIVLTQGMYTLADYLVEQWPQSVIVTNEVGSGIVPVHRLSRLFRDLQGRVNQVFAHKADEVYLCVSGVPLKIKGPGSPWSNAPALGDGTPPWPVS
jgi:adenosylcobinamide kinase/adenosylcobinamide-phosphate guanylyltransferase